MITALKHSEAAALDRDRLAQLYVQLGDMSAEDVVCRAMEELAVRLGHSERLFREGKRAELRKCARSMIAIGEQIGMQTLAVVAKDVMTTLDAEDDIALAATFQRLIRVGERSLVEIWDLQDLSV